MAKNSGVIPTFPSFDFSKNLKSKVSASSVPAKKASFPKYIPELQSDKTKVVKPIFPEKVANLPTDQAQKDYIAAKISLQSMPSTLTEDTFKKILPLPSNASSFVSKKVLSKNKMSRSSFTDGELKILYKAADNAYKRTGKLKNGTEYVDYNGTSSNKLFDTKGVMDLANGKVNPIGGTLMGAINDSYDMASTLGRFSYVKDPKSGNIIISDAYDFKNSYTQGKDGKLKKDYMKGKTDSYSKIRKELAENDQNLSKKDIQDYRINLEVFPSDTLSSKKKIKYPNKH